jgi:hypothetical protein
MNANDDDNTMLRDHIAHILHDATNKCNPRCHVCKTKCEEFVMDTAYCFLTKGEDNVVKIEHLCQNNVVYGILQYNDRIYN